MKKDFQQRALDNILAAMNRMLSFRPRSLKDATVVKERLRAYEKMEADIRRQIRMVARQAVRSIA